VIRQSGIGPSRRHGCLRFLATELDPQFSQLFRIHRRGRLSHQFLTAVVFRKRHHVADGFFAADQHDEPIKPERDSAVRRRTQPEGAEEMTKLGLLLFRADSERVEHLRLQL